MDKLVKRTAQAQKQATRRAKEVTRKQQTSLKWRSINAIKGSNAEIRENMESARKARKEDWELGPLAPKRDLGFNSYGAMQEQIRMDFTVNGTNQVKREVAEKRCAWAGSPKQLNLVSGDRIVLLEGPDKGKIDRIRSVDAHNGLVTLEQTHKGLLKSPIMKGEHASPLPISVDAIRLVYPITNASTGITKDSIINQLRAIPANMQSENMSFDRWEYGQKWDRIVPGINVVIPWPEVKVPEFVTHDADTARDLVEERSFNYNLLQPPMPPQVLDQIRNPFSRFRTRHEPWYIAQKEMEAAEKKRRSDMVKTMQTPTDELGVANKAKKALKGEPELTEEMLEKLGQVIAQTKAASLEDAGVSEVSKDSTSKSQ